VSLKKLQNLNLKMAAATSIGQCATIIGATRCVRRTNKMSGTRV
jgi:hypothetical protein